MIQQGCRTVAEPSADVLLQVKDLRVSYGDRVVLDGLSLSVRKAEIYGLLGGNGAGKSTALQALLGLLKPQSGSIDIAGVDPRDRPDLARERIAYIPENVALYDHLSAKENVSYFLSLSGGSRTTAELEAAFGAVGLAREAWGQRVAGFSKGMRQKTAIAIAILRSAPLLLMDEPTSGLDPGAAADFNALCGRLRDEGAAILVVSHDLLGVVDLADRIGFLDQGRIVAEVSAEGQERFDLRALHDRFARARPA